MYQSKSSYADLVRAKVGSSVLVKSVVPLDKPYVRIETTLLYPEGAYIDIFVNEGEFGLLDRDEDPEIVLCDLSGTLSFLEDACLKPSSPRRRAYVEEALLLHGAYQAGSWGLCVRTPWSRLEHGVLRLAQACSRVANLSILKRFL